MPTKKQEKLPVRQATEAVLLKAGKPLHYREISRLAIEQGIVKVKAGKRKADPDKTMKTVRSYLCEEEGKRFKRIGPGIFDLTAETKKALERAAKAEVKANTAKAAAK